MSPEERLETVQFLREQHFKIKGTTPDERGKGLRRTVKVIKSKQSADRNQDRVDLEVLLDIVKKRDE